MIAAMEAGFFRREIADAAFAYQREVDAKRKLIVGVNAFRGGRREADRDARSSTIPSRRNSSRSCAKARRSAMPGRCAAVSTRCGGSRRPATNLMPALIEAAQARCTVGEMMNALADVFGRYDGAAKW